MLLRKHPSESKLCNWNASQLQPEEVRKLAERLKTLNDSELKSAANDARESFSSQRDRPSRETEALSFALSLEAIRRTIGIELYDVQLQAADAIASGAIAEMATGEGKTLAAAPAAMLGAMRGQSVHVATPNAYLAERDSAQLQPAFEALGISVDLLPELHAAPERKQFAYDCDVTYGTGYEFGFDYLRDQLASRTSARKPLGQELLDRLAGNESETRSLQRGQDMAIVDEVDNVLLDDAGSPLILSDAPMTPAEDGDVCRLARQFAVGLQPDEDFHVTLEGSVRLTDKGTANIHDPTTSLPVQQLRRPWGEYVEQALRAEHLFKRDAHYVIIDEEVQIVDGSTGRIFSDRTWSDGLHQAIEAKEGLVISNERSALAQITRQRHFRLYTCLAGMTGTARGCEREFQTVYNLKVHVIPRRLPCQREIYPLRGFADAESKWDAVAAEVEQLRKRRRPVLVGTRTIAESEHLASLLTARRLPFQLLNGRQDAEEAAIVSMAGQSGSVTIATNLAGRGTDIRLDEVSKGQGGLHVIVSEPHDMARIDRQLIGRCARQGDPGSARTFVSADDHLIQHFGPWLASPIRQGANSQGEVRLDLSGRIAGVQRLIERRQSAARMALMRRDLSRESLMSGLDRE